MRMGAVVSVFVVLLASHCAALHGQVVSVYGMVGGSHSSNVQISSSGTTAGGWSGTIGGGMMVNFLNLHLVKLGLDARGSGGVGTNKTPMAEISLRMGFQPPAMRLKPFVQVGVGYAAPTVPISSGVGTTYTGKFFTVGGHAGLDRPITAGLDWRLVDVGLAYGHDLGPGFASGSGNTAANFFNVGTGLVVHF